MTYLILSGFTQARKWPEIIWATRKKNPQPNKQFDEVDWEHLDLAMKNKPDM